MTESTTCPQCGSPLSAHAVHGICPRCLLQAGFESRPIPPAAASDQPTYVSGTPAAPQPEEVAALFPQLEILELLGRGGMGAVYKARQRDLHRIVALKILPPELARDPAFGERFVREARALASLNHPQIVTIYDFGQAQGVYYLLMEYVDGVNLRQAQQAGHIEPDQVLRIISQICEALQYAHEEGVVHRDIKPENILLDRRGRVKIADFGLAKLVRNQPADLPLTQTQQVMGTLHYMAPEQLEHPLDVDHRADIFSLGVVFYELLTGELPLGRFETPSHKVQIDVRLDEIVLRALERNPERRYQWASQVKTELDTVSHTPRPRAIQATSLPNPAPADRAAVANRLRIPAIGLCIVGAISCVIPPALLLGVFLMNFGPNSHGPVGLGLLEVLLFSLHLPFGVLLVVGSLQMLRLNSYPWAMAASILGLFPCSPVFFVSLPLGIWALFVLSQEETRSAFQRRRDERAANTTPVNSQLTWSGFALLISGSLQLLFGLIGALVIPYVVVAPPNATPTVLAMGLFLLFGFACLVCSALMIAGGVQMLGRSFWGLARIGAIAALIPLGPWWLITFPCGLWALLVLHAPHARESFRGRSQDSGARQAPGPSAAGGGADQPGPLRTKMAIPAVGLLVAAVLQVLFTVYMMNVSSGWDPNGFPRRLFIVEILLLSAALAMTAGAAQMLSPGSLGLARAGAIAGLLSFGPGWIIGFPSGIWALIVLHRPDVRTLFLGSKAMPAVDQPETLTAGDSWGGAGPGPPFSGTGQFDSWSPGSPRSRLHPARLKLLAVLGIVAIVAGILLAAGPGWRTALFDAADRGDAGRIQTLLVFSREVNITDRFGDTPLIHAARNGHVLAIRALTPSAAVDQRGQGGMTALMVASIQGNTGAVEALLDAKARVDELAPGGETSLMFAAHNGHWDTLVALLRRGADPSIQNRKGGTALMAAAEAGQVSAVDILLRETQWTTSGQMPGMSAVDAFINLRDLGGETALMKGVRARNNGEIVRRLLEAHADPQVGRADGTTPLFDAARAGEPSVIDMLLQAKADPNQKRADGETPLSWAVAMGRDAVIERLQTAGATPVPSLGIRQAYSLLLKSKFKEATPLLESSLLDFPDDNTKCRFGINGWEYELPDTRRILQLLLAECLSRAGEKQRVSELLQQVLAGWSKDNNPVGIYGARISTEGKDIERNYSLRRSGLEGWRDSDIAPLVYLSSLQRESWPRRQMETRGQSELEGLVH